MLSKYKIKLFMCNVLLKKEVVKEVKKITNKQRDEIRSKLTDDTVKNIQIMAPYLDEAAQNRVFGLMLGVVMETGKGQERGD